MNNFWRATVAAGVALIVGGCATTSEDEAARFQTFGRIEGDRILPSGTLKIDNRSLRPLDSGDVIAWVVVQLDSRTDLGERSFSARNFRLWLRQPDAVSQPLAYESRRGWDWSGHSYWRHSGYPCAGDRFESGDCGSGARDLQW